MVAFVVRLQPECVAKLFANHRTSNHRIRLNGVLNRRNQYLLIFGGENSFATHSPGKRTSERTCFDVCFVPVPDIRDQSSQRTFALRPIATSQTDRRRPSDPT
jgi:hypothetical protein